jgi:predicted phosphodiesterase
MVQLREKELAEEEFEQEARRIQALCRSYGVPFLINDNVELARRIDADGVHVGQSDMVAGKVREYLGPDKIIGVTAGNHENRIYKSDGIDVTRLICRELGVEDKYAPEGVLIFLRFGTRNGHGRHVDKNPRQWYSLYATHGSGGGRKEGAKAIRLADLATIVDADIYISGHTHLPMIMKQSYFRGDPGNCSVKQVTKLFVNAAATLAYGGYGQAQGFKPACTDTPVIHLEAEHKRMSATM